MNYKESLQKVEDLTNNIESMLIEYNKISNILNDYEKNYIHKIKHQS